MSTVLASSPADDAVNVLPRKELSPLAQQAREEIESAGKLLLEWGSLSTRGKGAYNAGIRIPGEEKFVLGSFGSAIVAGFDGVHYEGEINRGLKEVIGVYSAVFTERPDINAVLHTHSPYLTAHAIAHKPFRIDYWSLAKKAGTDTIPVSDWAPRYSPEPVVKSLRENPTAPAVLLRNRGLIAWGSQGLTALAKLLNSLEEGAEIAVYAQLLGGGKALPEGALATFLASKKG
jgi:L-ribulose-5-phosphate 4-epimerase